jgi:hypothetical protein
MEASQDPSQKSVANASMAPEAAAPSNGVSHCGGVAGDVIHAYRTFDRVLMGDNASLLNISAKLGNQRGKTLTVCTDLSARSLRRRGRRRSLVRLASSTCSSRSSSMLWWRSAWPSSTICKHTDRAAPTLGKGSKRGNRPFFDIFLWPVPATCLTTGHARSRW